MSADPKKALAREGHLSVERVRVPAGVHTKLIQDTKLNYTKDVEFVRVHASETVAAGAQVRLLSGLLPEADCSPHARRASWSIHG